MMARSDMLRDSRPFVDSLPPTLEATVRPARPVGPESAEHLVLRRWKADDAQQLYELAKDPRIGPPAGWPPHQSVEESSRVIEDVLAVPGTYCIAKTDGTVVGCVGLKPIPDWYRQIVLQQGDRLAVDLGYWLGRPYWHHGYATECASALIGAAFALPSLLAHGTAPTADSCPWRCDAVYATHNTDNPASGAVMRRLGMREVGRVGHLPQDLLGPGVFRDEVVCRIDAARWQGTGKTV